MSMIQHIHSSVYFLLLKVMICLTFTPSWKETKVGRLLGSFSEGELNICVVIDLAEGAGDVSASRLD